MIEKKELEIEIERIVSYLKLDVNLKDLVYKYKRVYANLDGASNRMKLMGNIHYTNDDGYVKSKSFQLFRLQKKEKDLSTKEDLIHKFYEIRKLCYCVEQLKLFIEIEENNRKIIENDYEMISGSPSDHLSNEIDKFFAKRKRRRNAFA